MAVLERLTLALVAPERLALSGDTDGLVSVLEQLALTLKTSGQKALVVETEKPVREAEIVSTEDDGITRIQREVIGNLARYRY